MVSPARLRRACCGAAAYVLAIVNWFMILVTGESVKGIREFQLYYLRWRTRAVAYMALFVDPYPPFGDAPYPATIAVTEPSAARDRATIARAAHPRGARTSSSSSSLCLAGPRHVRRLGGESCSPAHIPRSSIRSALA